MKKLLVLTVLLTLTVTMTGCEWWNNLCNRGSQYSDPPVCYPPPCVQPMSAGCSAPACPSACGAPGTIVNPGPGT